MTKSKKIIRLSVSLLLLVTMLITPFSPVFAVVIDSMGGDTELTAADIVSEDASKREQFSRHYLTGDGTYFAVSYAEAVNYQDEDGSWIAVDNSLSSNVLTGYKSTRNEKFKVKFANKANKDDLVSIQTEDYKVSFGITVSEDGENYLSLSKVKGTESASNTSADPKTTQEATSLGKSVSGITYKNAFSDYLDVRYTVAHEKVKEDIILQKKSDFNSYKATYDIKEKDALATLNDDGSITFISPAGEVLFKVGAPVMYDAEGKASSDIAVSMVQTKKTVEVTYTPNSEWLNAEERVYPVIIDPEMRTLDPDLENDNIEDVSFYYMIFSQDDILSETPYLKIGADNFTYIKFHTVPTIPSGATLLGSSLVLQGSSLQIYDEYAPFYVDIRTPSVDWNEDSFVYTEGQEYAETLPTNQTVTLNNITFDYNDDENAPIYIELSLHGFYTTTEGYTDFYSSDNGFELSSDPSYEFVAHSSEYDVESYRPALVVRYGEGDVVIPPEEDDEIDDNTENTEQSGLLNQEKLYYIKNIETNEYLGSTSDRIANLSETPQIVKPYFSTMEGAYSFITIFNEYYVGYSISTNEVRYAQSPQNKYWALECVETSNTPANCFYVKTSTDLGYALTVDENDVNKHLKVDSLFSGYTYQMWQFVELTDVIYSSNNTTKYFNEGMTYYINTNLIGPSITSSNPSVVSVNEHGILQTLKPGFAKIMLTDGSTTEDIDINVVFPDGYYYIKNKGTVKYIQPDDNGDTHIEQHSFVQLEYEQDAIQIWKLHHRGDGEYTIQNTENYNYLSVDSNAEKNDNLIHSSNSVGIEQRWYITASNNDAFLLKSKSSELYAGVGIGGGNGVNVRLCNYTDDSNYKDEWIITSREMKVGLFSVENDLEVSYNSHAYSVIGSISTKYPREQIYNVHSSFEDTGRFEYYLSNSEILVVSAHGTKHGISLNSNNMVTFSIDSQHTSIDQYSNIQFLVLLCCSNAASSAEGSSGTVTRESIEQNGGPKNIFEQFVYHGVKTVIAFNSTIGDIDAHDYVVALFELLYNINGESPNCSISEAIEILSQNSEYADLSSKVVIGGDSSQILS